MLAAMPNRKASWILSTALVWLRFSESAVARAPRRSCRPPPGYRLLISPLSSSSPNTYLSRLENCRSIPAIWLTHIELSRETWPSLKSQVLSWSEVNSWLTDAFCTTFSLPGTSLMKSPHAPSEAARAAAPRARPTPCLRFRIGLRLRGLAVQVDRDHPRARLRVVEVVQAAAHALAGEVRLGVDAGVVGPGLQVPAAERQVHAAEPEAALHPGLVHGVRHRHVAQLHVAGVLQELRERPVEAVAEAALAPAAIDQDLLADPRARVGELVQEALPEGGGDPGAVPGKRALVRPVAVERAGGAVPDLAAAADVEQPRDAQVAEHGEGVADAPHPARVGVAHHVVLVGELREAARVQVHRAGRAAVGGVDVVAVVVELAAPEAAEVAAVERAEGMAAHAVHARGHQRHQRAGEAVQVHVLGA